MRALTLTQPWAGLVASGIKLVENRPRRMIKAEDFGKPFAIHASREIREDVYQTIYDHMPQLDEGGDEHGAPWHILSRVTSAVIGVATIIDALYIGGCNDEAIARALARFGYEDQQRFTFGPTVYVLKRSPIVLKTPVPCRGFQGFWTLPADVAARVEQLR